MFIDQAKFVVKSGKGGAGAVSFRREKFVQLGGPDGGDGGNGGDVYFVVDNNTHTLSHYKGRKKFAASNGAQGMGRNMSGKKGQNLDLIVPPGTSVYDAQSGELIFDLLNDGERKLFLKGGKGGLGNVHFKNSVNQRPEYAQPGLLGEEVSVRLELKLIADIGLVGFPNVGKSTLISVISNARPEIANYEFTTLTPKLGLVDVDMLNSYVVADIPGIIEGASDGKGLGLAFLRHIERTKALLYMLDLDNYRDINEQFKALKKETHNFSELMDEKPFAVALTRSDVAQNVDEKVQKFLEEFKFEMKQEGFVLNPQKPHFVMAISSVTNSKIKELKFALLEMIKGQR